MKTKMFYILTLDHTAKSGAARLSFLQPYVNSGTGFPVKDVISSKDIFMFNTEEAYDIYEIEVNNQTAFIHEKDGVVLDV